MEINSQINEEHIIIFQSSSTCILLIKLNIHRDVLTPKTPYFDQSLGKKIIFFYSKQVKSKVFNDCLQPQVALLREKGVRVVPSKKKAMTLRRGGKQLREKR